MSVILFFHISAVLIRYIIMQDDEAIYCICGKPAVFVQYDDFFFAGDYFVEKG